ncbi:MAG: hypothetical protein BWK72_16225 [Rhodoferax ferrireducens]|uniref:Fimbrial assembly n=1 Tax=Rhodoferax ferrireducens TaxID=192843 RepID=A0A1W9KQU7_9BURK|nr:MAG: hypothetical protein BWK72_16225 [Rhodoferax ferrireducens]
MNPLDINFVKRRRLASSLGWLLLAAGLVAAGTVSGDYLAARDELGRVEMKQARSLKSTASPARRALAEPVVGEDRLAVERVVSQLQLPWDTILSEIETRTGPKVALLDIEAQGQTRTLRLTGEAKSMSDVVAYLGRLRQSRYVAAADLSHHEEKQSGAVPVIRFSLDATWKVPS